MIDNRDFSYNIPSKVFLDSTLNATDLRVYGIIRSFQDTTDNAAYPSNKWIGLQLNVSERTISRSISALILKGHIKSMDVKGKRYLFTGNLVHKPVDKKKRVDKVVVGGRQSCRGGVDKVVYQLEQNNISSNNIKNNVIDKDVQFLNSGRVHIALIKLISSGIVQDEDRERLAKELTYHIEHRPPQLSEAHALNAALKLLRSGKWSTPYQIATQESTQREEAYNALKEKERDESISSPVAKMLAQTLRKQS